MANRRPQNGGGRRMDFGRNDRNKNFGRSGVSPWQGGGPGGNLPNLLPLSGGSTEATLALASNLINLLQPRQNAVPSLLDMPIRRDFGPNVGRYDRGYGPNRMGNQGNFRRTGNYNRAGERINNRKPFKPNDGQRQHYKSSPKKDADSKAKPVKESETEEGTEEQVDQDNAQAESTKKEPPKTRYDDINPQLLKCHICNKSMWDGRSFENHLSGRAHSIMMQKTAESYALTADTMRQEFKIREMKRTRKSGSHPARDFYCAMCDMYAADGAIHRTTVGHRKLKKYLHPTCTSCHKEMPTRIELDEHRLTAEHLKNMQDKQEIISKPKPEVMVISTLNMEQLYLRENRQRRRRGDNRSEDKDDKEGDGEAQEDGEAVKKEGDAEGEDGGETKEEEKKPSVDNENTILDYQDGDDLSTVTQEQFPVYSTERGVGVSFLSEFRCVQCRLCHKLLDSDETAAVHVKTWRHYQLFSRLLHEKTKGQANEQTDEGATGNKRALNPDDDGNFKRRRTDNDADGENGQDDDYVDNDVKTEDETMLNDDAQLEQDDGDSEMPPAEELDNWEQTVDEILEDEAPEEKEPEKPIEEEKPVPQESPKPVEKPKPAAPVLDDKPRASPRGRGRGRGRARGRY